MKCSSCRNVTKGGPRLHCFAPDPEDNKYCAFFTPMTNGDRIRNMTDEELEEIIRRVSLHWEPWCDRNCEAGADCNDCLRKWLQQPVEEDAG